jgi:hypothetical protein
MNGNNIQLSDEEMLQFKMFQEQMKGFITSDSGVNFVVPQLSGKEIRKSSYVRRTLSSDEYIMKVAMLHPFAYFGAIVLFAIGLGILYYLSNVDLGKAKYLYFPYEKGLGWFFVFMGFCKYLNLRMTEMVVTTKRVICKTGIIAVNTEELKNARIESVEIKQTLWQRLWRYADIYFTGTGVSYVLFTNIKDARSVKSTLEDNLDI